MYDETYPIIEKSDSEDAIIEAHEFAQLSVRAASEMKAEELVVLDVRDLVSYCDYFVLCNGTNARQVRAIAQRVLDIVKKTRHAAKSGRYGVRALGLGGPWRCSAAYL